MHARFQGTRCSTREQNVAHRFELERASVGLNTEEHMTLTTNEQTKLMKQEPIRK